MNPTTRNTKKPSMQERYVDVVREMKSRYGIRINKWRSSTTGCAWEVHYRDGSVSRLIESPYPKGPMSAAVFLHEVGHHAIGLGRYQPRCLEEFKAWEWSLNTMQQYNLNITPAVRKRVHDSLHYALQKALRRGLKNLPPELTPFIIPSNQLTQNDAGENIKSIRKAAHSKPRTKRNETSSTAKSGNKKKRGWKNKILWLFAIR